MMNVKEIEIRYELFDIKFSYSTNFIKYSYLHIQIAWIFQFLTVIGLPIQLGERLEWMTN